MRYIPREVFDKRAVEKNQMFHAVSFIEVKPLVKKGKVAVEVVDIFGNDTMKIIDVGV